MKVLVLGDVHGNEKFFARACRVAVREGCDTILQVGDFGYWEHYPHGSRFLAVAQFELESRGLKCIWICGNHENHPLLWEKYGLYDGEDPDEVKREGVSRGGLLEIRPNLFYAPRGYRWEWEGTSFLSCGGAYSIDEHHRTPGTSWWATEMITDDQVDACIEGGPVDVVISHDAPWGFNLPALAFKDSFPLSTENRKQLGRIVEQVHPNLLIHGHYHHRYGNWHTLANGPALGKRVRIEGLGADLDGDEKSWLVLDLADSNTITVREAPLGRDFDPEYTEGQVRVAEAAKFLSNFI